MQSIEEQQHRIAHIKQEIELANESNEVRTKLTQQLQKESEYLNERFFLSSGTLHPDRSPFQAWLQYLIETPFILEQLKKRSMHVEWKRFLPRMCSL